MAETPPPPVQDGSLFVPMGTPIDTRWNCVLAALPAIGKTSRNEQQGFNYRSIDAVLNHLHILFAHFGVHVFPVGQSAVFDSYTTGRGTTMWRCRMTVNWEIRSVDGEVIAAQTMGTGTDSGDKDTSKAQTMAFKYLLWPSTAVAENDDPDGSTVEDAAPRQDGYELVNGEQIPLSPEMDITRTSPEGELIDGTRGARLFRMAKKVDESCNVPAVCSEIIARTVTHTSQLTVPEYNTIFSELKRRGA